MGMGMLHSSCLYRSFIPMMQFRKAVTCERLNVQLFRMLPRYDGDVQTFKSKYVLILLLRGNCIRVQYLLCSYRLVHLVS
jgi:hypothetical protein